MPLSRQDLIYQLKVMVVAQLKASYAELSLCVPAI